MGVIGGLLFGGAEVDLDVIRVSHASSEKALALCVLGPPMPLRLGTGADSSAGCCGSSVMIISF